MPVSVLVGTFRAVLVRTEDASSASEMSELHVSS